MTKTITYDLVRCVDCSSEWSAAFKVSGDIINQIDAEMVCHRCHGYALPTAQWDETQVEMLRAPDVYDYYHGEISNG